MSAIASQITGVSIAYSTVCSGADQRKHQSPASLAFVRGIHRWPVTWQMFPFDDVIMYRVDPMDLVARNRWYDNRTNHDKAMRFIS